MYACVYKCILEQECKIQSFFSDVTLARQAEVIGGIVIGSPLRRAPPLSHQHQVVSVLQSMSYNSK